MEFTCFVCSVGISVYMLSDNFKYDPQTPYFKVSE